MAGGGGGVGGPGTGRRCAACGGLGPAQGEVGAGVWGYSRAGGAPPPAPRNKPWRREKEGGGASLASPSPGRKQSIRPQGIRAKL